MRPLLVVFALILCISIPVLAEEEPVEEVVPLAIPVPAGAKITTEINASGEQLVAQLGIMLSMNSGSEDAPSIDIDALEDALGTLERVQFAEMKLTGKYTIAGVLSTFEKEVTGRRIIWNVGKSGYVLIATDDGGYFGAKIDPREPKPGKPAEARIRAIRLMGFVDVPKTIQAVVPVVLQLMKTKESSTDFSISSP